MRASSTTTRQVPKSRSECGSQSWLPGGLGDNRAMAPLLEAIGVRKSFGGVRALRGVSFELRTGEVHALVGENGAGKSTLVRILTGAVAPDEGEVRLSGEPIPALEPAKARALGIAVIYQQPALFPDLTVAENIALNAEAGHTWRLVNWRARNRHAAQVLERVGAAIRPQAVVSSLSMPDQQLVGIAKAISAESRILIMDEPTASLGDRDVKNVFRIVSDLKRRGCGVIYISHRFEELFAIADRVTVLRDGESIGAFPMAEMTPRKLIHLMVGRQLEASPVKRDRETGAVILEVRNVCHVSLTLRRGEILGLAGLAGAGRTRFAETLFGLHPNDGGEILAGNVVARITSPEDAMSLGLALLPEDRRRNGVIMDFPIAHSITLASLGRISRRGLLRFRTEWKLADEYAGKLGVKAPSVRTLVRHLSGGNQQKTALARALMTEPRILILDEPAQGIDVAAKGEIHALIRMLAARGMGILLISSDLPEILDLSDRIAVMHAGRIAGVLDRDEADSHRLMELALGHTAEAR